MLVAEGEGALIRLQSCRGKALKEKDEIESLINAAIANKFNMFTKHEFTYTFNIITTAAFTTV